MEGHAHIRRVEFDRNQRVVKASIFTSEGLMHVHWSDLSGHWCWYTTGSNPVRPLGIPLIPQIEEMGRMLAG